jgi:cardiolipin synthase
VAAVLALFIRDLIPLWVVVALLSRDVLMSLVLLYLKRFGITGIPVHFVGKAATMNLLYALPLILLGTFSGPVGQLAHVFGWAFLIWGITMYWYAGLLYYLQVFEMRRAQNAN